LLLGLILLGLEGGNARLQSGIRLLAFQSVNRGLKLLTFGLERRCQLLPKRLDGLALLLELGQGSPACCAFRACLVAIDDDDDCSGDILRRSHLGRERHGQCRESEVFHQN
jgi:hypothetical protein